LIAKDHSLFGKATSDPYAKVYMGSVLLGQTPVVKKNTNPVWNAVFNYSLGADAVARVFEAQGGTNPTLTLFVALWDYDRGVAALGGGKDDPMGTVVVALAPLSGNVTKWYPVGKGTGISRCEKAKGEVEIKVSYEATQMRTIARGQTQSFLFNRVTLGLAWDVERGQKIDLDSTIVAVDRQGHIMMNETVYYGNLANSNSSIHHSGDEVTGETVGDDEKIILELDRIPFQVLALYIVLTVATPGKSFGQVKSASARFLATETKQGICRYVPHFMGDGNTALFLARISRQGSSWILTPIEEGNKYERDFGSLIPEIKGYTRDLVPGIVVDPQERVAVMRKGGAIRVSDYVPGGSIPAHVCMGLAWDVTNGKVIDLDASAVMFDANLALLDIVSYRQLTSKDGSIRHSGDEREGDEAGDDEVINISLPTVSPKTKYIGIVINSFSGHELDDVASASCHLFDPKTRADIATYTLTNSKELDKHTALIMGCLYRGDSPAEWFLRIISCPTQGRTADKNVDKLREILRQDTPRPPPHREEEEIVVSAMPYAVPMDDEIVVVPDSEFSNYVVPVHTRIAH
jgi:tellurium resistance protein TerZ